jgi:hypothetical protein
MASHQMRQTCGQPPSDTVSEANIWVRAPLDALNGIAVSAVHVRKNPANDGQSIATVFCRCTRRHVHCLPSGVTPSGHSPLAASDNQLPKSLELSAHWPQPGLNPVDASFPTLKLSFPMHVGGYLIRAGVGASQSECGNTTLVWVFATGVAI